MRINFRFWLLVRWSSRGPDASSHIIWCKISLSSLELLTFFPKFKMAATAILDFQFTWIWLFRHVDSVVFVFCTKFGSNICYSDWDRRTYASELHLMTSREFTSGFDFCSRGHLRVAAMHLPMIFGADIFIQSGVIDIFSKIKDGRRPHLGFVWVSHGTTHKASFVVRTSCTNFFNDRLGSFQVITIWFFLVQAWNSYSRPKNISFGGISPQKFRKSPFKLQKGTSLRGTTRFEPSLVQIQRTVRECDLWP